MVIDGGGTAGGGDYDIAVIGGGINGCGIARDAAGRGLAVFLCEQADLGGGTSSASSKLIHGGLRYLEQREFKLVRDALRERETLRGSAPHLITPMRFVLPHHPGLRPAWLIRAGLLLYDLLGGKRSLSRSRGIRLTRHSGAGGGAGEALKAEFSSGFEYADCWVDDARLVVTVAKDARRRGATIATRTRCDSVAIARNGGRWQIALRHADGSRSSVRAKALVNATGPWVARFLADNADALQPTGDNDAPRIKLVQGSHLVVRKWYDGAHAYILQNADRRVVFVIPFQHDLAIIGTTEVAFRDDPENARITPAETEYLCAAVGRYFTAAPTPDDVVWRYSGVRPLVDDGADNLREVTRDYVVRLSHGGGGGGNGGDNSPPIVTIYGGKLTTFRRLAEATLAKLAPYFPAAKPPWTADAVLPGGGGETPDALRATYPFLPPPLCERYLSAYGGDAFALLGNAAAIADLGTHFGHGLYETEVAYQIAHEWATDAEDILWRRTKLGLRFEPSQVAALERWLASQFDLPRPGHATGDERQPVFGR